MQHIRPLANSQQGASVTGIVLLIIGIVVGAKLLVAIIPAQVSDYQLTKMLAQELRTANQNEETAKQFTDRVNRQLSINADYNTTAEDVFTFTDEKKGQLKLHKQYEVENNFFGNVFIVNRFEGNITQADATS